MHTFPDGLRFIKGTLPASFPSRQIYKFDYTFGMCRLWLLYAQTFSMVPTRSCIKKLVICVFLLLQNLLQLG